MQKSVVERTGWTEPCEHFLAFASRPHCVWLDTADEIFATNSLMEIVAVVQFKDRKLEGGQPAKLLQQAYREFECQELAI